jgi:hypothetical protein
MDAALSKTFVLNGDTPATSLWLFLKNNWRAMLDAGKPLQVVISEHKEKRSNEQNQRMWAGVTRQIAEQVWVNGRQYSAAVWHEHLKEKFLPDEVGPTKRTRKGYRKWEEMPDGSLKMIGSTTKLTTFGMAEFQTEVEAYAATELGVRFVEASARN